MHQSTLQQVADGIACCMGARMVPGAADANPYDQGGVFDVKPTRRADKAFRPCHLCGAKASWHMGAGTPSYVCDEHHQQIIHIAAVPGHHTFAPVLPRHLALRRLAEGTSVYVRGPRAVVWVRPSANNQRALLEAEHIAESGE